MKAFYYDKTGAVQFANDLLRYLKPDSPLTMTIVRDMSGAFSVAFATTESSEDTDEIPSSQYTTTSQENTPAG